MPDRRRRPDVTTIVVTHQNAEIVGRCLAAVEGAVARHSQEIVVVDNASSDGTVEIASGAAPQAEVVALPRNLGFAAANNVGIAQARGRFVALVNSDCFPDRGSIDVLLDAAEARPRAGLVGGRLRYADGRHQSSGGQMPTLVSELWIALGLHRLPITARLGVGILSHPALYHRPRRVGWVSGAFCLARPEIGPLSDLAFMYGEDLEWAAQARRLGFETWLEPRACAVHLGGTSVESAQSAGFVETKRVEALLRWFARRGRAQLLAERGILCLHALLRLAGAALLLPVQRRFAVVAVRRFSSMLRASALGPSPSAEARHSGV